MSDEHIRSVAVKRSTKKKSGYAVEERGGEFFLTDVPKKAQVNVGDKVTGINGIRAEEFVDEDDANGLIESIRIVVVPEDEIEDYEAALAEEGEVDDEEEEDEETTDGKESKAALVVVDQEADPDEDAPRILHCPHCGYDNENLMEDEDGDLVCENCGHVIEPEGGEEEEDEDDATEQEARSAPAEEKEGDDIRVCRQCGHHNRNLERDEDGDYVCEECGYTIPEDEALVVHDKDPKTAYTCPDCGHITYNPQPDEEGDRICEKCGCILPEKVIMVCDDCGHENVDPQPDEEGDYVCENCGAILYSEPREEEAEEEPEPEKSRAEKLNDLDKKSRKEKKKKSKGQKFGDDGKPVTNKDGKKLTPADMFQPGDVITVTVGKSSPLQDPGLKVEERNGKYYVRKVPSGGLFSKTPVIANDKILELNGKDARDYRNVSEMKRILKDEGKITIVVLRPDPDASESEADSVDYDNLNPIGPDGVVKDEIKERDDDTIPYDGHDCGCVWCPVCSKK